MDAELVKAAAMTPEDLLILGSSRMLAPAEVQRRILASAVRTESLLTEIRDLLMAQATEPAPKSRRGA